MVLPLIPLAIGAAGLGGGFGIGSWLSKGKKEIHAEKEYFAPTSTHIEAEPYQYYNPQLQFAPVTSYGYQGATNIISSPGAVSKKEQIMDVVSRPEQTGTWDIPTSVSQSPKHTQGVDMTTIAIIAAVALVAAAVVGKSKKRK